MSRRLRVVLVRGPSMAPAVRDGDRLLVWLRPRRPPAVGSLVVVDLPDRPLAVKRLASIEPDGGLRVEGDNPFGSTDSREFGALAPAAVRGVVLARLWPRPGRVPSRR
jgi:phage repressor protein C with HTH and peptisase S24 domain